MKNKNKTEEDRICILVFLTDCDGGVELIRDTYKELKEFIKYENLGEYYLLEDTNIIEIGR